MSFILGGARAPAPKAPGGSDTGIVDISAANFEAEVISASTKTPVIVDFWAPWCGPCKQLGPALEKAVAATGGKVRMVKVDIDQNPEIAQALRIQSIPTVYAFFQGRPVDAFMGAVPESQIKQFVDKLIALAGGGPTVAELVAEAKDVLAQGDKSLAAQIFQEALAADPANAPARAGLARLVLEGGDVIAATALLDATPPESQKHADILAARTALQLAADAPPPAETAALEAAVQASPDDHQKRFDLAMSWYAAGQREAAIDALLEIVRRDRAWNEEGARKQLVKFFEAIGFMDPVVVAARRRLSTLLFS